MSFIVSRSDATERLNKDLHEPRASVIFNTVSAVWFVFYSRTSIIRKHIGRTKSFIKLYHVP